MLNRLASIPSIIEAAKMGQMFILIDDENRENEGDLIIPAQFADFRAINFMAKYGRGLICLCLTEEKVLSLGLPMMVENNTSKYNTAFTISIEAREGVTTGISAYDRAQTIKVAIDDNSTNAELASPGHVFPIKAKSGGVLERAGHTEASIEIAKLACLNPSAVLCEIMKDDGHMARLPDLLIFAQEHNLKIASISDLISYMKK